MKNKNTTTYFTGKQATLPLFLSDFLDVRDPVLTFDQFMEGLDLEKYLKNLTPHQKGRIRYNPVDMLKTVLFGFMTSGYISLRELEDNCKVNIRFMYLMDHKTPSYRTFGYFINEVLAGSIEEIFYDINQEICPNGKRMLFAYRKHVKGNQYGRQEEIYRCEDCSDCPFASECKRTDKNRTVRINEELTSFHREVLGNLESIHGALLRMNRSIQAEGTFGIMKQDRWYKRIVRKGIHSVKLELYLVAIGQNLYKYHNKQKRTNSAAA